MTRHVRALFAASSAVAFLLLAGCGSGSTGATCPTGGTQLTYQNFGKTFMTQYCTRCHSSTLSGAARQGAPTGLDVDTLAGVRASAEEIDHETGAGPNGVRTEMPPNGTMPTTDEREKLSEWLACGAPE